MMAVETWPPENTRFFLIGTVHGDPRGFRRLRRFLDRFQPDLILVEMSPFAWAYRKTHGLSLHRTLNQRIRQAAALHGWDPKRALTHPQVKAIRRQIAMPFEFRASYQYAQCHKSWPLLIDRSDFSASMVAFWSELLSVRNLEYLLALPASSPSLDIVNHYRKARTLVHPTPSRMPTMEHGCDGMEESLLQDREESLAERIRGTIAAVVPKRCAYVGGWEHLRDQVKPPSLRCLLGVPQGRCHLLDDFDL